MVTVLPSTEVAAIVAAKSTRRDGAAMLTPPPAAAAKHLAKASVAAAITFASSVTDEDYLAKASKDSRITVRRAVADNPCTPEPSRQYLLDWAIHKNDSELADNLGRHVNIDHAIKRCHEVPRDAHQFFNSLTVRIVAANDPSLMGRAVATYWPALCHRLGLSIASERPSNISVTDVIVQARGCTDQKLARQMLTNMLKNADVVDVELAELLTQDPEAVAPLEHFEGVVSDAAAARLLETSDTNIISYVGWSFANSNRASKALGNVPVNEDLLNLFMDKVTQVSSKAMPRINANGLTTETAVRLIRLTEKLTQSLDPDRYLGKRDANPPLPLLPTESLVTVLGHGKCANAQSWLHGSLQQDPRPGEVALLVKDAIEHSRKTFYSGYAYYGASSSSGTVSQSDIAASLSLEDFLDKPWTDELVDCLGPAVFDRLSSDERLRDYVVRRVSSIIGISPVAWEMFFGLVENYTGSMIDLLTTTRRLLKINGEEIILPAFMDMPFGQLSLL
jgi:hypothetical protein